MNSLLVSWAGVFSPPRPDRHLGKVALWSTGGPAGSMCVDSGLTCLMWSPRTLCDGLRLS